MSKALLLFAPGAGAPSSHPWMQQWVARLLQLGRVELFDYDYSKLSRRRPDPLRQLVAAHRRALAAFRREGEAVILVGKSMGGRIGCHVSLEEEVNALICFGYPLCGGGDHAKLRDKVLRELTTPVLFIQGTRDPLCPLTLLEQTRKDMKAPNYLHTVGGGNHSLLVGKRQLALMGQIQDDIDRAITRAIDEFMVATVSG
ncbi:MAG: alpha/beta family hydrolase [Chthoniobacterales bacterium]